MKIYNTLSKLLISSTVILFIISANNLSAQQTNVVYSHIYSYKFSEALNLLETQKFEAKEEAAARINYYWWLAISGESETQNFALCKFWLNKLEVILKNEQAKNNDYLFYKVMLHAYQSRLAMFYKNYLSAGLNLHYCNNELKTSIAKVNEYNKFMFSSGLYYYFVERSLTDYPILYPYLAFFPKGNKNTGIEYLKKSATNSDLMVKTESLYFLMRIYFEFEKKYSTALIYVNKLIEMYPQNLVFRYYKIQILKKAGNQAECEIELKFLKNAATENLALSSAQQLHFYTILTKEI